MLNAHDVLEVKKSSSSAQVKKAWRRLSQKYHPDRNKTSGAEEKFKLVQEAYTYITTGQTHTDAFKAAPPPAPKPPPQPAQPAAYSNPNFAVSKFTLNVDFGLLFKPGSRVGIPNSSFYVILPPGVFDGYSHRTKAVNVNNIADMLIVDVTYKLYDPQGFYSMRVVEGREPSLYCEYKISIAALLAEREVSIRNIDPSRMDLVFKVNPSSSVVVINDAGLPLEQGYRQKLYVKILPIFKSISTDDVGTLLQLRNRLNDRLDTYSKKPW